MSTVEAFLLGIMVALTPGMVVMALLLCAVPSAEDVSQQTTPRAR